MSLGLCKRKNEMRCALSMSSYTHLLSQNSLSPCYLYMPENSESFLDRGTPMVWLDQSHNNGIVLTEE